MIGVMMQTAFLVIAILLVRKLFGRKLHAYVRYSLWLLVVFRLLLPVNLVESPFSMLRVMEAAERYGVTVYDGTAAGSYSDAAAVGQVSSGNNGTAVAEQAVSGYGDAAVVGQVNSGNNGAAIAEHENRGYNSVVAAGKITDSNNGTAVTEQAVSGYSNAAQQENEPLQADDLFQSGADFSSIDTSEQIENSAKAEEIGRTVEDAGIDDGDAREIEGTSQIYGNKQTAGIQGGRGLSYIIAVTRKALYAVWLIGILLVGGFLTISHIIFRRRLMRTGMRCEEQDCRLPVYRVSGLEAPCLVGLIAPAVYIGAEIPTDSPEFQYVRTHEEVHYLHGDHVWAFLRAMLVTLYWFHPLVWAAAVASVRDGEMACDHGTIRRIGQGERFAYGEMLLKLSKPVGGKRPYSYGTMLRPGKSELKERIVRLTEAGSNRVSAGIVAVLLMAVMAGCAFTGVSAGDSEKEADAALTDINTGENDSGVTNGSESPNKNLSESGSTSQNKNLSENGSESQNKNSSERGNASENGDLFGSGNTFGEESDTRSENHKNGGEDTDDREAADSGNGQDETITESRQISVKSAELSKDTPLLGADGPVLDFAGNLGTGKENVIIFHNYFGLVIYDLDNREILRSLDLASIGCHMTQGDDCCQVAVAADGTTVWLHPMSKRYMYRFDVADNLLYQEPLVKTFQIDLEGEQLFDRYLTTEENPQKYVGWRSNYLYEEYKDEKGVHRADIYLYTRNEGTQTLCNLFCTWDDMEYVLWDENGAFPDQASAGGVFPYRYDGAVEEVLIMYDKPCAYSRIAASYESRVHPVSGETITHEGIDYVAEEGTDIFAAADGVVYEKGRSDEHGIYVVLLHVNGDFTYYFHCKEITAEKGDRVKRGEKIATVGSTGRSIGAHLHFALSQHGWFVDPEEHMKNVIALN